MLLDNKFVIITGAKGGLGSDVTAAFLNAGARVAGVSRSIQDSDFPHPAFTAAPAELTSFEATRAVVAARITEWGRIDAAVHLAGAYAGGASVAETSDEELDRMLDINFRSAFHFFRAVIPYMRLHRSGRILAIGSRAALEPQADAGAYSASKAALVSLIRTIAVENAPHGVSANIVLPGTMDTPANRKAMPQADFTKWVQPAQVAALLVHLASSGASQITGAAIPVYGADA